MIIDRGCAFSWDQAITGDAASTDALDLGQSLYDIGPGADLVIAIFIAEAFNNLTSLTFQLQCDDDSAFGSPRTLTQLNIALADLTAGRRFTLGMPKERTERYARLYFDVTGSNPSTGKVRAWITDPNWLDGKLGDA